MANIFTRLDNFRKEKLRQEMIEGFESRDEEDLYLANAGMEDYLRIIEESEKESNIKCLLTFSSTPPYKTSSYQHCET